MPLEMRLSTYQGSTLVAVVQHGGEPGVPPTLVTRDFGLAPHQVRRKVHLAQRLGIPVKDWRRPSRRVS